jgi:hypothetical protein
MRKTILVPAFMALTLWGCSDPAPGPQGAIGLPARRVPQDLPDQPGLKVVRDNKDLSAPKVPQDQEVRPGLQAFRAQSVLKELRVKAEHRDPQVHQASEVKQEYRDHPGPLERLAPLARPGLQASRLRPRRKCTRSPGQNR